jgi:hypothetical protein
LEHNAFPKEWLDMKAFVEMVCIFSYCFFSYCIFSYYFSAS